MPLLSPEVITTNLPYHTMYLLSSESALALFLYTCYHLQSPLLFYFLVDIFSKTFDIIFFIFLTVINISNTRGHCWEVPFLVNRYISVIEELCNGSSLSFGFDDHFNFPLGNIFWIVKKKKKKKKNWMLTACSQGTVTVLQRTTSGEKMQTSRVHRLEF